MRIVTGVMVCESLVPGNELQMKPWCQACLQMAIRSFCKGDN